MDTRVILFSSDATLLYKGDIFRVLALPEGHTIQFRYPKKYVAPSFRETPEQLVGKESVIFFLAGNDLSKPIEQRQLTSYPIRSCCVIEAFYDSNTQQIIMVLKLEKFVNCKVEDITDKAALPPTTFVTVVNLEDLRPADWSDRVGAVESSFPKVLFYRIGGVMCGEKSIEPAYAPNLRLSRYILTEESEYSIECSYYDPEGNGITPLEVDISSSDVDVRNLFESGAGARVDTRRLPLITRTLKSSSAPAYMKFRSGTYKSPDRDPNYVEIHWQLARASSKPMQFGFLTLIGAIGLFIANTGLKNPTGNSLDIKDLLLRAFGGLLIAIAASFLFKVFNKV